MEADTHGDGRGSGPRGSAGPSATRRSVLVTGCSSGIGAATALRLHSAGWSVWATARRPESLGRLREAGCRTLRLDVTDQDSMKAAVDRVEEEHGSVGALVNNAGYSQSGALETLEMEQVRRQFETNVYGPLRLAQLVLPGMRRAGTGRVVNVSSMGGRFTFPGAGAYHASKHALESLSDALRLEVRSFGVDVVVIEPGLIRTGFADTATEALDQIPDQGQGPYTAFNRAVARITREAYREGPLASLGGGPDDVAKVIEKALRARKPRARYRVTASATVLLTLRALLPDALWDAFLASQYPLPRSEEQARPGRPTP